jgi:short-subunit dehydrogenase
MSETPPSRPVCLITGASSGIGAALAREYAARGATLVLVARRVKRLERLASELGGADRRILSLPCDVTRDEDLVQVVQMIREKLGRLDTVIANAGFGVIGNADRLTLDDYRRQFETNVFGVIRTYRETIGELRKTRGRFAIVSSVNGYLALPGNSPYGMSKFAVRAFADSVREEVWRDGVSVTLVAPGFVESEIRQVDNRGQWHPYAKDIVPSWIVMRADRAARVIASGIERRRAEQIVTRHGVALVFLARHFPRLTAWLIRLFRVTARPQARAESHEA